MLLLSTKALLVGTRLYPPHQPWMCEFAGIVDCPDEKWSPIVTYEKGFKRLLLGGLENLK